MLRSGLQRRSSPVLVEHALAVRRVLAHGEVGQEAARAPAAEEPLALVAQAVGRALDPEPPLQEQLPPAQDVLRRHGVGEHALDEPEQRVGEAEILDEQLLATGGEVRAGGDARATAGVDVVVGERPGEQEVPVGREPVPERRAEPRQRAVAVAAAQQQLVRAERARGDDHGPGIDLAALAQRRRRRMAAIEGELVAAAPARLDLRDLVQRVHLGPGGLRHGEVGAIERVLGARDAADRAVAGVVAGRLRDRGVGMQPGGPGVDGDRHALGLVADPGARLLEGQRAGRERTARRRRERRGLEHALRQRGVRGERLAVDARRPALVGEDRRRRADVDVEVVQRPPPTPLPCNTWMPRNARYSTSPKRARSGSQNALRAISPGERGKSTVCQRRPRSSTHTDRPACASRHAVMLPPKPDPMTTTSYARFTARFYQHPSPRCHRRHRLRGADPRASRRRAAASRGDRGARRTGGRVSARTPPARSAAFG